MNNTVLQTLTIRCGVDVGSRVCVALSGGRDSVVLTHLLRALAPKLQLQLSAVHIHHGLRSASDAEENFVRQLCAAWEIPLTVHRLHLQKQVGMSTEMLAREERYRIFDALCRTGELVATAHHLDDCMETLLINLCRGSGSKGLASIPYRREGIIRPMLDVSEEQVAAYAMENGLSWVEDESNADTYYLRNFMRHEILPRLRSRQDISATAGFAVTLQNLRQEDEALTLCAAQMEEHNRLGALGQQPRALVWRYLQSLCPGITRERFGQVMDRLTAGERDFVEQIDARRFVRCTDGRLTVEKYDRFEGHPPMPLEKKVPLSDGRTLYLKEIHSQFTLFDIDRATIGASPVVRSRAAGDTIHLPGRPGKRLKKLFAEARVELREHRVVIADEQGVLWVEGFGADKRCAPGEHTCNAWRITIKDRE